MDTTQHISSTAINSATKIEEIELDKRTINALLRKIDLRLMPLLVLLFFSSFVSRINISQAVRFGLVDHLGLSLSEYKWTLWIYYISYSLCTVPLTLLMRRLSPSKCIAVQMFAWGIITILMMLVNNLTSLLIARFFLGIAEAGVISGTYFHLSLWYIRRDHAFRIGIFMSGAVLAYVFDGILAYGIMQIDAQRGLTKWQWLCLVEGILTIGLAIITYKFLTDPDTVQWLNQCNKDILTARLLADVKVIGDDDNESLSHQIRSVCLDWKVWFYIFIYTGVTTPFYGLNLFLPKIIEDMSFANTTSELLGVPPYLASYVTIVISSWSAGFFNERSNHIMILLLIEISGFLYLIITKRDLYIGAIIVGIGVPSLNALTLSWITNNIAGRTQRAIVVALGVAATGIAGIISGEIYDKSDDAYHNQRHWIIIGMMFFTFILVLSLKMLLKLENKRRKNIATTIADENPILLERHPGFAYVT